MPDLMAMRVEIALLKERIEKLIDIIIALKTQNECQHRAFGSLPCTRCGKSQEHWTDILRPYESDNCWKKLN